MGNQNIENNIDIYINEVKPGNEVYIVKENIKLTVLGQIKLDHYHNTNSYLDIFKSISEKVTKTDMVYTNLGSKITRNLEEGTDSVDLLDYLNINVASLANNDVTNMNKSEFDTTVKNLKESKIEIAGINNNIVYKDVAGKTLAFISANNVGDKSLSEKYNISYFDKNVINKNIKEAKSKADLVIVEVHYGHEYVYKVTEEVNDITRYCIDSGADLVLGSHLNGVYPVVRYKGKYIIHSIGNLYTNVNTGNNMDKIAYIFDFNINKDNNIDYIQMTPYYITYDKVIPFIEYDSYKCNEWLKLMNGWNNTNGLNSKIEDNVIKIY